MLVMDTSTRAVLVMMDDMLGVTEAAVRASFDNLV